MPLIFLWWTQFLIKSDILSPNLVLEDPSGVQLSLNVCMSICIFICWVIRIYFWRKFVRTVILRSACGRSPQDWSTSRFKIYKSYMFITMCQLTSSSCVEPTWTGPNPLKVKSPEWQYNTSFRPSVNEIGVQIKTRD